MYRDETVVVKILEPTRNKAEWLGAMSQKFSLAVQLALDVAQAERTSSRAKIHKQAYRPIREQFQVPSEYARMAVNQSVGLARSFYGLRKSKLQQRTTFPKVNASQGIGLGVRAYAIKKTGNRFVLRATTGKRGLYVWLPLCVPAKFREKMQYIKGDARIFQRGKHWFAMLPLKIPIAPTVCTVKCVTALCDGDPVFSPRGEATFIGIDLGIVRLATVSSPAGVHYFSGKAARHKREHFAAIRRRYQRYGRRDRVKEQKGSEQRWMRNLNHVISKQIVAIALQHENPVLVLEQLRGIRKRVQGSKRFNRMMSSWTFRQLVEMICYKADKVSIPVIGVDPRGTSRTCPKCGHSTRSNRPSQSQFRCVNCNHRDNADKLASGNIAAAGARLWQQGPTDTARLNRASLSNCPVKSAGQLDG